MNLLCCELCGCDLPAFGVDPTLYIEFESLTCPDCGSDSTVAIDPSGAPYIGSVDCKHGIEGGTDCDLCDPKDERYADAA